MKRVDETSYTFHIRSELFHALQNVVAWIPMNVVRTVHGTSLERIWASLPIYEIYKYMPVELSV